MSFRNDESSVERIPASGHRPCWRLVIWASTVVDGKSMLLIQDVAESDRLSTVLGFAPWEAGPRAAVVGNAVAALGGLRKLDSNPAMLRFQSPKYKLRVYHDRILAQDNATDEVIGFDGNEWKPGVVLLPTECLAPRAEARSGWASG